MKALSTTSLLALMLAACGGESMSDSGSGGTAGSGGTGGSVAAGGSGGSGALGGSGGSGAFGGSGGSGATGGSGGVAQGGTGGSEPCVPVENPPDPGEYGCEDLFVLTVSEPSFVETDGDGVISPGETATLQVLLNEVAGHGFSMYPGVAFESDHPGVSVKENDWYYAIFACQSHTASATLVVSSDVPPGTQVTLTARVAMINQECPDAYAIQIPLTIQ